MNENTFDEELFEDLKINCQKCFGFCCVALYFSASDGFPNNKGAGKPCLNLQSDFSCSIHKDLRKKDLKVVQLTTVLVQDKRLLKSHMLDIIGEKILNYPIKCMKYF